MFRFGGYIRQSAIKRSQIQLKRSLTVQPESTDVVVIGGGSAGCHLVYALAKRGIRTVLLERSKLTSGTTWHTGGLVWRLRPNDIDTALLARSTTLLTSLGEESGLDSGYINNGGLFIAHSKTRLDEYKRLSALGNALGIENHIMSSEDVKSKVFPLLDSNAFLAALYSPTDGVVDPSLLCTALTKVATKHGAKVIEDCEVKSIITGEDSLGRTEVKGVQTQHGEIRASVVVNATGVWGKDLIEPLGIHIPLIPMRHAYIVSEPIKGIQGMPNIRDHDASVYFRIQGSSIHMGGYELNPILLDSVAKDFSFSLYDLDWSTFENHVSLSEKLCPAFAAAGVRSTVCGPESFTPDHKPLLGPDPRLHGLFHSCGYNSAGMMFGGGCGEELAHWIDQGRPELNMFSFDVRRFLPKMMGNVKWATERSHEAYTKNYSMVFPNDQPLSGRNAIRDSLHEEMLDAGAFMEEKQGWERPGYFNKGKRFEVAPYDWNGFYGYKKNDQNVYEELLSGDCKYDFSDHFKLIGEEAMNCRNNAALFNLNYFSKIMLTGRQAQEAADWIFSADTNKPSNKLIYTCALNDAGGVECDSTVSVIDSGSGNIHDPKFEGKGFYVVSGGASAYYTYSHLTTTIRQKGFDAQVSDVTEDIGVLSIQGPNSQSILRGLCGQDFDIPAYTSALVPMKIDNDITPVRVMRISFVGELGYELHYPISKAKSIYKSVFNAGQKFNLDLAGYRSLYSLSCEKGYHLWNFDLRMDDSPIEANLGFVCRKNGTYRGSEVIKRQRETGIQKRLVTLTLDEKIPLWGLEGVYRDGVAVGHIRRAEFAYYLNTIMGKSYIRNPSGSPVTAQFLESGKYEIDVMGKRCPAKLHLKSPFDPSNKRVMGDYS